MRTARSSSHRGGAPPGIPPGPGPPWDQAPPPGQAAPQSRPPQNQAPSIIGADPPEQTPPPAGPGNPSLWKEFLTHACENITLPQTSVRISG